tara:strand:- start:1883 stop:2917 length:1035 start_codon:yes stop_codon:yes gene_type:complete
MKLIIIGILITNIYSQCDTLDELNCNHPLYGEGCEWNEDIDYASCSDLTASDCSQYFDSGCVLNQDCLQWGSWYSWLCYSYGPSYCTGGSYELDNSYCQEIEMTECYEMNETECSSNNNCDWVEDLEIGNCSDITNGSECYQTNQCSWYSAGNYGYWYDNCYGGTYEIDNSYCEEIEMTECSDLDELNCNHPLYGEGCEWIESDINCENISSESECDSNNCDWNIDVEYGNCAGLSESSCDSNPNCYYDCEFYHGSCAGCCYGSCLGGTYQIDDSYCDGESYSCNEIEFETGDVNQDYLVNVADVIFIINLVITNNFLMEADLNHDFTIDVTDIILTVNIILGR